jgi:DNA-binding XRE family transcriptional regulator
MNENTAIFWDKNTNLNKIKAILKNEQNPRFVEFSSLLLARNNQPKLVFAAYLGKKLFVRNWTKIKRRMRENSWNDPKIIFWEEIYKAVKEDPKFKVFRPEKSRPLDTDPEISRLCLQIKTQRKQLGLTQRDLAKKTGLSQQAISFAEQGYANISLRTLKKVTDALSLKLVLS